MIEAKAVTTNASELAMWLQTQSYVGAVLTAIADHYQPRHRPGLSVKDCVQACVQTYNLTYSGKNSDGVRRDLLAAATKWLEQFEPRDVVQKEAEMNDAKTPRAEHVAAAASELLEWFKPIPNPTKEQPMTPTQTPEDFVTKLKDRLTVPDLKNPLVLAGIAYLTWQLMDDELKEQIISAVGDKASKVKALLQLLR